MVGTKVDQRLGQGGDKEVLFVQKMSFPSITFGLNFSFHVQCQVWVWVSAQILFMSFDASNF